MRISRARILSAAVRNLEARRQGRSEPHHVFDTQGRYCWCGRRHAAPAGGAQQPNPNLTET